MIGLDIDKYYVRVAELKETSAGTTLTKSAVAAIIPKPEENISQAISRTISEVFKQEQIEEKEVYTSISGPRIQVRRMALPAMPEEELSEAIKWEAKNFVPFSIETAAVDYSLIIEAEGKGTKQELIMVAVDGEALKKHLELIKEAGLKCAGITPIPFALGELTKLHPELSEELVALVNMGAEVSSLNLFKKNSLLFSREIDVSGENITDALASTLKLEHAEAERIKIKYGLPDKEEVELTQEGIDPEELRHSMYSILGKLQNELLSSFDYYRQLFFEEKISRLLLSGGTAKLKNLPDYLTANFGIPVELIDPLRNIQVDPKIDQEKLKGMVPRLAVAIGLALGKGKEINLLKVKARKKIKSSDIAKILEHIKIPNSVIIGTPAAFIALIVGLNLYLNYSIIQARNELNAKSLKLGQLVKFRDRKAAFEDITKTEIDVNLLLARVNTLMPEGLTLAYLNFDNKKGEVSLGGESENPKIASAFVKSVEESPYFRKTQLIEIKKVGATTTFKMNFYVK
ncbi:hypothetical protein AMJ44_04850 [candidate division WOR-1 bacterium DG_54_3]|uniref:SHS2 domain-containing protein n=1 Tax=candidate division WOR-1 bacterium DG_54_3 TaxID=1703775 RepID=A0A0S7Y2M1_UNCSA|nr:MAG: hypothetical protein AMJ44_04850 [candidate division WOR-1 bacterium DG_54_3]